MPGKRDAVRSDGPIPGSCPGSAIQTGISVLRAKYADDVNRGGSQIELQNDIQERLLAREVLSSRCSALRGAKGGGTRTARAAYSKGSGPMKPRAFDAHS